MGYIPPRPQRPDETTAEYVAYLEDLIVSRRRARALTVLIGLGAAFVVVTANGWWPK